MNSLLSFPSNPPSSTASHMDISESSLLVETPVGCLIAAPAPIDSGASSVASSPPRRKKRSERSDPTDSMEMLGRFRNIITIADSAVKRRRLDGDVQRMILSVEKLKICKRKRASLSKPIFVQEMLKSLGKMQLGEDSNGAEISAVLEKLRKYSG